MNVDGRSKLDACEAFIQDTAMRSRKILCIFRLFVTQDIGPNSSYRHFCDEYTQNRRVGLCNIIKDKVLLHYIE